jgi:hypothetical protein
MLHDQWPALVESVIKVLAASLATPLTEVAFPSRLGLCIVYKNQEVSETAPHAFVFLVVRTKCDRTLSKA